MNSVGWPSPSADAELIALLNASADALIVYDHAFRFLYLNDQAERQSGISRATMIGRVLWEVFPDARTTYEQPLTRAMQEHVSIQFEAHYEPTQSWTECRCLPLGSADIDFQPRLAVFYRDITQSKRDELEIRASGDALRASESRYQRLLDASIEGIALIDERDEFTYANAGIASILGYDSPDEIVGLTVYDLVFPDEMENAKRQRAIRRDGVGEQYERRLKRRDGSEVWGMMSVSPEYDPSTGAYQGTFLVMTDVTQRVMAEKALTIAYRRERLLNEIGNAIRGNSLDAVAIQRAATAALGPALNADRCYFAVYDYENDISRLGPEWHRDGLRPVAGEYRLSEYTFNRDYRYKQGNTQVIEDVRETIDRSVPAGQAEYEYLHALGLRSLLRVPLTARDVMMSLVLVMAEEPRRWIEDEIRLVETVAAQSYAAIETALHLAREQARAEREALLSNASTVLNASLDYRQTLTAVARLTVPRFADWCAVDLFDDAGVLQRVAVEHVDPAKVAWGWELYRRYPPKLDAPNGVAAVLRTGTSEFYPLITEEMLTASPTDPDYLKVIREIGLTSVMMVPLVVRGRVFGALTLVGTQESDRRFTTDDLHLAEEIGRRAALAIENARLFHSMQESETRQRRIAETLQRSMLLAPEEHAFPPLAVGTHYEAAWDEAQVGGDFFDVMRLDEDRIALIVGDSTGKGLDAARYTSELLFVLRAYLRENSDPAVALHRLNGYLVDSQRFDQRSENALAAVAVAVLDAGTGNLQVASGGAEPALLLRADTGLAEEIESSGTVLGAEVGVSYDPVSLTMQPGDMILLITDGLTEARNRKTRQFFGYDGFMSAVEAIAADAARGDANGIPLTTVAQTLVARAKQFAGGALTDDVCLLIARYR